MDYNKIVGTVEAYARSVEDMSLNEIQAVTKKLIDVVEVTEEAISKALRNVRGEEEFSSEEGTAKGMTPEVDEVVTQEARDASINDVPEAPTSPEAPTL